MSLLSGKVLIAGGGGSSADLYDPTTGTFTATGSMTTARGSPAATLLPSGKVLVAGGGVDGSAELYDPTAGTFTATGSMIRAITDNTATRAVHTATLLPSGKVLVAGGLDKNYVFASAELYDPAAGTFTVTGSMTAARWDHSATFLGNGKVLIAGGSGDTSAELYDPTAGTFATTGSMTATRYSHTATLLLSGKVLITGGRPDEFTMSLGGPTLASAELYQ
jgi:WD40 repeat protein